MSKHNVLPQNLNLTDLRDGVKSGYYKVTDQTVTAPILDALKEEMKHQFPDLVFRPGNVAVSFTIEPIGNFEKFDLGAVGFDDLISGGKGARHQRLVKRSGFTDNDLLYLEGLGIKYDLIKPESGVKFTHAAIIEWPREKVEQK